MKKLYIRSVRLEWDSPRANQNKALIYQIVLQNRAWKENLDPSHTVKLSTVVENLHPGTPYYAYGMVLGENWYFFKQILY